MRVKVLKEFVDKDNFLKKYTVDETVEFSDERSEELISKGLVEKIKVKSTKVSK